MRTALRALALACLIASAAQLAAARNLRADGEPRAVYQEYSLRCTTLATLSVSLIVIGGVVGGRDER